MKLGLIIITYSSGETDLLGVNKDHNWVKHTFDPRSHLNNLEAFDGTGKDIIFINFLEEQGYLICLAKARPQNSGRPNDNTAAWIHVPANIAISGKEVEEKIEDVKQYLAGGGNITEEQLKEKFNQEYIPKKTERTAVSRLKSNESGTFAYRYYGKNQIYVLHELLGDAIAQKEYSKYKAVFFIDISSGIKPKNMQEIKSEIYETCFILPPKNDDGFKAVIENTNKIFNQQLELSVGDTINIVWEKNGYKDVLKKHIVKKEDNNTTPKELELTSSEYKVLIPISKFYITDSRDGKVISNCNISINNIPLIQITTPILESELKGKVKIEISKNGYKKHSKQIDNFLNNNENISIELKRNTIQYEFNIPINDSNATHRSATISINTTKELTESPIDGYSMSGNARKKDDKFIKNLHYKKQAKTKRNNAFFFGFLSTFFLCFILLVGILFWCENNNKRLKFGIPPIVKIESSIETNVDKESAVTSGNGDSEDIASKDDNKIVDEGALEYLKNPQWKKEEMEEYEDLKDLFDDMDQFRLDKIIDVWDKKLSDSIPKFNDIVKAAQKTKNEGWNPKIGVRDNGYIRGNEKPIINIDNYIEWLSKDNSPKQHQPNTPIKTQKEEEEEVDSPHNKSLDEHVIEVT